MAELLQANWIFVVIALAIGVLVAWWVFAANRKTRIDADVDAAPSGPARRNSALIDAPPAAAATTGSVQERAAANTLADFEDLEGARSAASPGATSGAANSDTIAAAGAAADAEAGAAVPAREAMRAVPASLADKAATDNLTQIKGLGPKLQTQLHQLGVTTLAQIAAWDDAEIDRIDSQLGRFQGRIRRDDWRGQARLLTAGDRAAYEEKFGRS